MKKALLEIYTGLKSLFIGLKITLGQFFRPTVTVRYPYQTLKIPARFRGHIELVSDPATGKPKCFVCKLCERACPSDCITVDGMKPEGAKRKTVTVYRLDFTKCSLCGSCVEACRDGAIRFSREYNLAGTSKEEFIMDLFKRLESEGVQGEQAQPVTTVAEPRPPAVTGAEPPPPAQPQLVSAATAAAPQSKLIEEAATPAGKIPASTEGTLRT
ncbi:NADH-ubiquinone oxidoreductase chain I [Verrucomicrobia bacterium]|nr:NADH-ubiquinone oxidoreductase chain I [Verrucomicrobiota bacterium]